MNLEQLIKSQDLNVAIEWQHQEGENTFNRFSGSLRGIIDFIEVVKEVNPNVIGHRLHHIDVDENLIDITNFLNEL